MECQPWLTGVLFGLLSFKPEFGILFPMVLLASRNWRIFFSATVTSLILALIAAVAFGYQVWPVFIAALAERAESLSQDPTLNSPLISFLGMLQFAGTSAKISWSVQLIVTVMTALVVGSLWARPVSYALKAAALAIGSILAAPHAVQYDLCILSIAAAFLVRDGLVRGFLRGERVVMLICWTGIFLKGLYPAIVCVVLLTLVIRRVNLNQRGFDAAGPRALASAKA
jgi:hypothetical protein